VRALLPYLQERFEVDVVLPPDGEDDGLAGTNVRAASELEPLEYDHLLFAIGNEPRLAYAYPILRRTGGCVALFDWCLAEATRAAYPGLAGAGPRARWLAAREGGTRAALRAGTGPEPPAMNRSVVRWADSFIVPDDDLRQRVLGERNEPTPIAVVDPGGPEADVADRWCDALASFPRHRSARSSVLRSMLTALKARVEPSNPGR
jgi:hypothetical protein